MSYKKRLTFDWKSVKIHAELLKKELVSFFNVPIRRRSSVGRANDF